MAVSAFTQLGTGFHSNATTQTSLSYNSGTALVFPTNGQDVLGVARIAISGTSTAETITVTDGTNNWTQACIEEPGGSSGAHIAIFYWLYPATSGTDTSKSISASWGTACNERDMVVGYLTGHDTTAPLDVTGTATGTSTTTTLSCSTSASAGANGTAVGAWSVGSSNAASPTGSTYPGTGWTGDGNASYQDGTRARSSAFVSKQISSAGVVTTAAFSNNASSATPPGWALAVFKAPGAPVNSVAPAISGTVALGNTLTVSDGTWTNSPTSYAYQWQRSSDSGSTWNNCTDYTLDGGATANTHTVTGFDVGSELRCIVTATNAAGSTPANSNATSEVAASSGAPSYRLVTFPIAQSDNTTHSNTLAGAVLPHETMVLLASSSVPNIGGDMGSVTDPNSNTWTLDVDAGQPSGTGGAHVVQSFSAQNGASKLNIGATITNNIKQTTASGASALNSATINVVSTAGFDSAGTVQLGSNPANTVTYTGITSTSLTGCGNHIALSGGEAVIYHGQSPYWAVYALNPGDGSTTRLDYDASATQFTATTTPSAGPITTTKGQGVAFTLGATNGTPDSQLWMTAGTGWTASWSGFFANHGTTDTQGINTGGESTYKAGAQARTYSSSGTSISGAYTPDTGVGAFQNTLVVAYGFDSSGGNQAITPASITATSNLSGAVAKLARITPAAITGTSALSGAVTALRAVAASIQATSDFAGSISGGTVVVIKALSDRLRLWGHNRRR